MKSSGNMWACLWNPGARTKKAGVKGSRFHCSSLKVVWSMMRLDPVMMDEFKSCLFEAHIGHGD